MTCKKEDRNLINHLLSIKRLTRFRIRGCHNLGRQIIRCSARVYRIHPLCRQLCNQCPDLARTDFCITTKQARHPSGQWQKGCNVQNRLAALINAEFIKHITRNFMFYRNGK